MPVHQFVAVDVETANADMGSICQVGVAKFVDGRLVSEWGSLVDPEDEFDDVNISIHGIDEKMIRGQPKLPEIADRLRADLEGSVSVCHTHFDRVAIDQGYTKYRLSPVRTVWLDSARVARRTWKDIAYSGYGLSSVCQKIGYAFRHHDALEDAKAAGHILLAAMGVTKFDVAEWMARVKQPIDLERAAAGIRRDGNPDGDLYGEMLVFTGALSMSRAEAADLAATIGCCVSEGVNKRTTILVVGDQDLSKLAGHRKSSKHRKAEQLIAAGQLLRIIRETDFKRLVSTAMETV
jgi:DNA polymerase III subunit epsilon